MKKSNQTPNGEEESQMIKESFLTNNIESIEELAKLSSKGQVTIPIEIRTKLNIREGDQVRFILENGTVRLEPVRLLTADELFGILNQPEDDGHFVLDLNEERRNIAEETIRNNLPHQTRSE